MLGSRIPPDMHVIAANLPTGFWVRHGPALPQNDNHFVFRVEDGPGNWRWHRDPDGHKRGNDMYDTYAPHESPADAPAWLIRDLNALEDVLNSLGPDALKFE